MMGDGKNNSLLDQDAAMESYLDGLLSTLDMPVEQGHVLTGMKLIY